MTQHLIRAIQQALQSRWFARLPGILLRAKDFPDDTIAGEAYAEGYRQGYWDAVVDLAESDLLKNPTIEKQAPVPQQWEKTFH